MASPGSALKRAKAAFIPLLQARMDNVIYGSPKDASEVLGEDGSGVAAWWGDTAEATIESIVMVSASEHWYDETVTATLVLQAIGIDTDATAEDIDDRTTEALGHAIGIMGTDPSLGIIDDEVQLFSATPSGWRNVTGLTENPVNRAGRYELDIEIYARLKLS